MYIKVKDRKLFHDIDTFLETKKYNEKFIEKLKSTHKLIKKSKNGFKCDNCNNIFKSNKKINEYCKCPYCKKINLVKSSMIRKYTFRDHIGVLEKYKEYYILRYYEIETMYNNSNYNTSICEYGRKILNSDFYELYEIINDNLKTGMGYCCITHKSKYDSNWKYFNSYYSRLDDNNIMYPYNLKDVLKGTKWQYSCIWKLAEQLDYFNITYLLKNYCNSVELLIKLGFYNLALCPKTFNKKGNFQERFGVPKEFAPYIKKYNLDIYELKILSYTKIKNISFIKKVKKYNFDFNKLEKYKINIKELLKRTDINKYNTDEYYDYLKFVNALGINLKDKSIKYPKNIEESHDKYLKQYNEQKDELLNKNIKKRYMELKSNTFSDKNYIIRAAKSYEDMKDESKQMNNCVRTYAEDYSNSECDIYFMRLICDKNKSLVTVEVRNNEIVQKRTKNNKYTTKEQDKFLDKFNKFLKLEV